MATLDGAPWFVTQDVCRALGAFFRADGGINTHAALAKVDADDRQNLPYAEAKRIGLQLIASRAYGVSLVSEPGLYRLVMRCDKPIARPFQDWVVREVLPAIRKTGGYMLAGADRAAIHEGDTELPPLPETFTEALRQHAATLLKLAEEKEAHARTEAERRAAEAAKAQAEREVGAETLSKLEGATERRATYRCQTSVGLHGGRDGAPHSACGAETCG